MVLEWLPVSDARALWDDYSHELSQDHIRRGSSAEDALNLALLEIRAVLQERGLQVDSYKLPVPAEASRRDWGTLELERELAYDREHEQREFERLFALIQACPEQLQAWNAIQDALNGGPTNVVFVDGPAGSGKTTLYKAVLHQQRAMGNVALAQAMLGIAALLLPGGRTVHSRDKLPVPLPLKDASCAVSPSSARGRLLHRASVTVWDEIGCAPLAAIEAVDRLYKDITGAGEFLL